MTTRDNLIAARTLVADGWVKGTLKTRDPDTGKFLYCAGGAVLEVRRTSAAEAWGEPESPEHRALRKALPVAYNTGAYEDLARFNDAGKTTAADILALYDRAIAAESGVTI